MTHTFTHFPASIGGWMHQCFPLDIGSGRWATSCGQYEVQNTAIEARVAEVTCHACLDEMARAARVREASEELRRRGARGGE